MKKYLLIVSLAVLLCICGCDSSDSTDVTDQERLQGAWSGFEVGRESEKCTLTISETTMDFKGPSDQEWYKATFTLDESVNPKAGDITITDCPAPDYVGKVGMIIYKIEDSTLTIAGSEPGQPVRPSSFDGAGDTRVFVLTKVVLAE